METIIITQKDLQCFGGFLQIIKQKNITDAENCHIVLQGDFNDFTIELFISDANKISELWEKQFSAITFPLIENIRWRGTPVIPSTESPVIPSAVEESTQKRPFDFAQGDLYNKKQYAKFFRSILFAKKILTAEGEISWTKFLDEIACGKNYFKNPISTNPDLKKNLLEFHAVSGMEKYWESWFAKTLQKAKLTDYTGTFENLVTPSTDGKFHITTAEDLYDYLYQFFYLRNRIGIVGYGEYNDFITDEIIFMIDSNSEIDSELKYAVIKKHDNKITLYYAPIYLSLDVDFCYLQHLSFLMENIFENLETHIDAVLEQAAKDEKQYLVEQSLLKFVSNVNVDEDEDATNNFFF